MSNWNDVNDKLPDLNITGVSSAVLATYHSPRWDREFVEICFYTIDRVWLNLKGETLDVTAWMPLPEPYIKKEKENDSL